MTFNRSKALFALTGGFFVLLSGCGGSAPPSSGGCGAANASCTSATGPNPIPTGSSSSSIPVYVADSSTTGEYGYQNEPLVSVTICTPNHGSNTSECQTISNILLDTGSFGLRVFGSAIASNVQLAQQTVNFGGETMNLAECAVFGTGADWGSVENGDVVIGGQTAVNVPIQVININYASIPSGCAALCPDTDPCTAGLNGILGVGPFGQDCGASCANQDDTVNPGNYFACDSSGCYNATDGDCSTDGTCMMSVGTSQQVVNPVEAMSSTYSSGISLTLPSVGSNGSSQVTGTMSLGIDAASGPTVYPADPSGMSDGLGITFNTTFEGTSYGYTSSVDSGINSDTDYYNNASIAFLDSGSNGFFFPSNISTCADGSGFYCPGSGQNLSATDQGYDGSPTGSAISFSIGDADSLFNTGNSAFNNVGGPSGTDPTMFDWGLPFFFNRTVYVGIDGKTGTIGGTNETGPYWAF